MRTSVRTRYITLPSIFISHRNAHVRDHIQRDSSNRRQRNLNFTLDRFNVILQFVRLRSIHMLMLLYFPCLTCSISVSNQVRFKSYIPTLRSCINHYKNTFKSFFLFWLVRCLVMVLYSESKEVKL